MGAESDHWHWQTQVHSLVQTNRLAINYAICKIKWIYLVNVILRFNVIKCITINLHLIQILINSKLHFQTELKN